MDAEDPVINEFGISRRELMRRGAIAGTLVWAAPVVRTFATPAFAQEGTPIGKDFSYVAVCYTCDSTEVCCVKWDLNDDGTVASTETGSFQLPGCSPSETTSDCGDPSIFTVTSPDGGQTIIVCADPTACVTFEWTLGVGKCGNPPESGECVTGTVVDNCITFSMCDA